MFVESLDCCSTSVNTPPTNTPPTNTPSTNTLSADMSRTRSVLEQQRIQVIQIQSCYIPQTTLKTKNFKYIDDCYDSTDLQCGNRYDLVYIFLKH